MKKIFKSISLRLVFLSALLFTTTVLAAEPANTQDQPRPVSQKTINIHVVELGVGYWPSSKPALKSKTGTVIKKAEPTIKLGDTFEKVGGGGASIPGVTKAGEVLFPMPTDREFSKAELDSRRNQLAEILRQKASSGVTEIEVRAVEQLTLQEHVAEAKITKIIPKSMGDKLKQKQKNLEELAGAAFQAVADIKKNPPQGTVINTKLQLASNGARTGSRAMAKMESFADETNLHDSRGSYTETAAATKKTKKTNIFSNDDDVVAIEGVVANPKTAEKVKDNNPNVEFFRVKNVHARTPTKEPTDIIVSKTWGKTIGAKKHHTETLKPLTASEEFRSFEVRRYIGNGAYEPVVVKGREQLLLESSTELSKAPQRREQVASPVTVLKSDGNLIPLNGNSPKSSLNSAQGFLGSHKDLQRKILSKDLPPESNSRAIEVTDMKAEGEGQIPYGWVPCSCPDAHAGLGIWVKGTMWHARQYICP